ncbi:MAG TPA: UDP-N-acetylmuramoyl-L-alanine--D-glutamate ligase [Bacteroidia bacterium]|nr:UDP-N-acetylmuramoyl-L-alanine--D-glutamate ligase [Bacteroidia bacterium]MBP7713084.1 UDP-N-acetylmuramoyl-L-alanine--D-glutamate ligase [Bacteroidia bacterium]MBP8668330.1 UDP-N-acetylmuramoyl-L-alanine--D-glutamate ligase [Bacteroidia bacterium]HOZ82297.1 UDP-N-acetylmuramoyl-L-alanine--D-glutamate ligase [Bacteroidia bacterium]HOZ90912.1 UDP-N-acetylmuramoyl-L-alanine--D-glutamate ligase [Bacteroidia bacterium]
MSKNKRIVILGAAESGVGAAILAQKQGYDVFVSDLSRIADNYKTHLTERNIQFEEGCHTDSLILNADEVVKSPGIPDKAAVIKKIKSANINIVSEIEFASRFTNAKMIAITGTNGKSTTTLLTYHILKKAGVNVGLAGNIGKSFAWQVAEENFDHYVLELSSFQLDDMYTFKADIAVLLNITPDHLDRYEYSIQNYIDAKFRIIQNQTAEDAFIYCFDDAVVKTEVLKRNPLATCYPFSIRQDEGMSAFVNDNNLYLNIHNNLFTMSIFELALQGKHNLYNSMAAGVAARILDIRKESIRESFADFRNAEHRMEFVNTVHGIDFINDSKATNVNSAWFALESMQKPVVWILGGVDKGNEYEMLNDLVKEKVKAIVCLGKDNKKIHEAFGSIVSDITDTLSAQEAVSVAYQKGKKGDVVLLSPCCASFDLFKNYEDRGRQFKAAVKAL